MTGSPTERLAQAGFSLIELSIVLIVFGLLASGTVGSLSGQRRLADERRAQRQLDETLEALYGFAITNGRLPCPAEATLASSDEAAGREACPLEHGVLPWRTLGVTELDPWGQRLSYYANSTFSASVPSGARAAFTLESKGGASVHITLDSGAALANELPAVIVSHGANGRLGHRSNGSKLAGGSADEAENANHDSIFVSHLADADYDDLVCWLPPAILATRMLAAGRLP
jgi:prepilin-type N-terminal cleavage/methylation domain-containing protein